MRNKRGITLIALVITVIVLLILAGITIAGITGDNGVINNANSAKFKAKFKAELAQYKEELEQYKVTKLTENPRFLETSLTAGKNNLFYDPQPEGETGNIKTVIPSLDDKYLETMEVIKGELLLNTQDKTLIKVAQSLGIEVNPYDIVDGVLLSSNGNLLLMDENGTVTIPDSVTAIGEGAFANLDGLKTIIIPGTVKEIKAKAFAYNSTLENVILQEGVESIGFMAFDHCTKLKQVELPESLKEIDTQGFYQCASLTSIEIPSQITSISSYAFCLCTSLTEVIFRGDNVTDFQTGAFSYCHALKSFTIPKSVTSIHTGSFTRCENLVDFTIEGNNFVYESGMLLTKNKETIIFLSAKYYENTTELTVPNGVKDFTVATDSLTNIKKINIPASVTSIDTGNFSTLVEELFPLVVLFADSPFP